MRPTSETYVELDRAYDHFNARLFDGRLPRCIITMQRDRNAYGYFWSKRWDEAAGERVADEIALNPDEFKTRPLKNVLSTLVHEMCHLQQYHFGKPSRNGYHNKQWGGFMRAAGLVPSETGQPGGKDTGQRMTHYIEDGGSFDRECDALLADGFVIPWIGRHRVDEPTRKKKKASKTKYSCPECDLNAWAKEHVNLVCGDCGVRLEAED